jgi:hypothetical protein
MQIIPEELFAKIAHDMQVDYYAKVLYGKILFYLLLYALLMADRPGQRSIAGLYASSAFRALFSPELKKHSVSHRSISERLSKVEVSYFEKLYEIMYERYPALYPLEKLCGLTLQRADSSPVSDASTGLHEGLSWGNERKKGKMLNYTINFDGMYGCLASVHKEDRYATESVALPENVLKHFRKSGDRSGV